MGAVHKVVLRFPRTFWNDSADFLGYASDESSKLGIWANLSRPTGAPILSLWSHGQAARRLERLGKSEMVREALDVIKRVFGASTPEPEHVAVTAWGADEFSRGAYVNLPVGATFDDLDALAAPVADRLFFAGEATSRRHRGTVHGAWLSGLAPRIRFWLCSANRAFACLKAQGSPFLGFVSTGVAQAVRIHHFSAVFREQVSYWQSPGLLLIYPSICRP